MSAFNSHTVVLAAIARRAASDDEVIPTALAISRANPRGELHFVYVVESKLARQTTLQPVSDAVTEGSAYLDAVVDGAKERTPARVSGHLGIGDPVKCILETAVELEADLLVIGTDDAPEKGSWSRLAGSPSQKLLRRAPCAVLLARAKTSGVPAIEPACPACTEVRFATGGTQLWCERHAVRHVHGHLHYGAQGGYGAGAMFVRSDT